MNPHVQNGLRAEPSTIWTLIDQIYATGQHPDRWPALLDAMVSAAAVGPELGDTLIEHLRQALRLNEHIGRQLQSGHAVEPVLANLRFPFMVVNDTLRVVYESELFSRERYGGASFRVDGQRLELARTKDRNALHRVLRGECPVVTLGPYDDWPVDGRTALQAFPIADDLAVIALINPPTHRHLALSTLVESYGLTESEASLAAALVEDASYAEIARDRGLSEHTIRSQVKQIFAKTHCHRRADLIHRVACGPALLECLTQPARGAYVRQDHNSSRLHQRIGLGSGDQLGYAEFGPEDGEPVVFVHNISGSRLQIPVPENELYHQNVRLIVPDRPGVGLSTWRVQPTMRLWAAAVEALLDRLDLPRVPLVGSSMGAVYAMASAACTPERVSLLVLVSPMAELDPARDLERMEDDMRQVIGLAHRHPRLARFLLKLLIRDVPTRYVDRRIGRLPEVDQRLYRDDDFYHMAVGALTENMRQGVSPMVRDFLILSQPWEFDPANITVPVQLWHGDRDITSPLSSVERLIAKLADCDVTIIDGETHMLLHRHWHTILREALARQRGWPN